MKAAVEENDPQGYLALLRAFFKAAHVAAPKFKAAQAEFVPLLGPTLQALLQMLGGPNMQDVSRRRCIMLRAGEMFSTYCYLLSRVLVLLGQCRDMARSSESCLLPISQVASSNNPRSPRPRSFPPRRFATR